MLIPIISNDWYNNYEGRYGAKVICFYCPDGEVSKIYIFLMEHISQNYNNVICFLSANAYKCLRLCREMKIQEFPTTVLVTMSGIKRLPGINQEDLMQNITFLAKMSWNFAFIPPPEKKRRKK